MRLGTIASVVYIKENVIDSNELKEDLRKFFLSNSEIKVDKINKDIIVLDAFSTNNIISCVYINEKDYKLLEDKNTNVYKYKYRKKLLFRIDKKWNDKLFEGKMKQIENFLMIISEKYKSEFLLFNYFSTPYHIIKDGNKIDLIDYFVNFNDIADETFGSLSEEINFYLKFFLKQKDCMINQKGIEYTLQQLVNIVQLEHDEGYKYSYIDEISDFLEKNIDFNNYEIIDCILTIAICMGLELIWNKIIKACNIENQQVIYLIEEVKKENDSYKYFINNY